MPPVLLTSALAQLLQSKDGAGVPASTNSTTGQSTAAPVSQTSAAPVSTPPSAAQSLATITTPAGQCRVPSPFAFSAAGYTTTIPDDRGRLMRDAKRFDLSSDRVLDLVVADQVERRSPPIEAHRAVRAQLDAHPETRVVHGESYGRYLAEHLPTFGLTTFLMFPIGWMFHDLGIHDQNAHFAATTVTLNAIGGPLDRMMQVGVNRVTGRAIAGDAVDFVGSVVREGETAITVFPRSAGLARNLWRAATFGAIPEAGGVFMKSALMVGHAAKGLAAAPFHMANGMLVSDVLDAALIATVGKSWETWSGRGYVKVGSMIGYDAANVLTRGWISNKLATTIAGKAFVGLAQVNAWLFVGNMGAWGAMRKYDEHIRDAFGYRAADIGDALSHTRPLARWMRQVWGVKDLLDVTAAGDYPVLSSMIDGLEDMRVRMGLMDPASTMVRVRADVIAQRTLLATDYVKMFDEVLYQELIMGPQLSDDGTLSPSRLLELAQSGWFDRVALPDPWMKYYKNEDARYNIVRSLVKLRNENADARAIADAFDPSMKLTPEECPLTPGMSIVRDAGTLIERVGGAAKILQARKVLLIGHLLDVEMKLRDAHMTIGDVKTVVDAMTNDAVHGRGGDMNPRQTIAAEVAANFPLIEFARAKGWIDERGHVAPSTESYLALGTMSLHATEAGDIAPIAALKDRIIANIAALQMDDTLNLEQRGQLLAEIKVMHPMRLFGESSKQWIQIEPIVDGLMTKQFKAAESAGLPSFAYDDRANVALHQQVDALRAQVAALLGQDVRARDGGVMPGAGFDGGRAATDTLARLNQVATFDAAVHQVDRLTYFSQRDDLTTAYQNGGATCVDFAMRSCDSATSLAHDLDAARDTVRLADEASLPPNLRNVPHLLRQIAWLVPGMAPALQRDATTGAVQYGAEAYTMITTAGRAQSAAAVHTRELRTEVGTDDSVKPLPKAYRTVLEQARDAAWQMANRLLANYWVAAVANGTDWMHSTPTQLRDAVQLAPRDAELLAGALQQYYIASRELDRNPETVWPLGKTPPDQFRDAITNEGAIVDWAAVADRVQPEVRQRASAYAAVVDTAVQRSTPASRDGIVARFQFLRLHIMLYEGKSQDAAALNRVYDELTAVRFALTAVEERALAQLAPKLADVTSWSGVTDGVPAGMGLGLF